MRAVPEFHQNRYALALDRLVPSGGAWLDVGAGRRIHDGWAGPSSDELAGRVRLLAGCDLEPAVLQHPHLQDARIADASNLPWDSATFDLVTANMVVEHLEAPAVVFEEVARVLKPGGAFLFVTPNRLHPVIAVAAVAVPRSVRSAYASLADGRPIRDVFPTRYRCNTVHAVKKVAASAALKVEMLEVFVSAFPLLPGPLGFVEKEIGHLVCGSRAERLLGSNILCVLRKAAPAGHPGDSAA
jgi:SAM-dependent methyltransferase